MSSELQKAYGADHRDLLHYYSTKFENEVLLSNYTLGILMDEIYR